MPSGFLPKKTGRPIPKASVTYSDESIDKARGLG
jgi:hypothetical protein